MESESNDRAATAIIALLSLAGLVVALQITLVLPLLPNLPGILGVSNSDVGWLVTITLLVGAVATPIVSRCADVFGKRKMMLISLTIMVIGSFIAAIGGTFFTVLIGRGLQGFASALIPVAMSILRDVVPIKKVAGGAAMISSTMGIGGTLGNPSAGLLFDHFGWTSVFWASGIAGLLLILGIMLVVPESAPGTRGRFDVAGAILLSIALSALMLGVSKGPTWGWGSAAILGCFLLTIVVMAIWIPLQLRIPMPLVNLRTTMHRPIMLTNIAGLFLGFSAYGSILATTQQLQLPEISGFGFGLSASIAGICMIPSSLSMVAFSQVSGKTTGRFGARITLILGSLVLFGAYIFRIAFDSTVWLIVVGAVLVSIGNAITYAALPTLILSSAPLSETAAANGINALARTLGTTCMSAVMSAVLTGITMEVAGVTLPSHAAFITLFVVSAIAALLGGLCAYLIPKEQAEVRRVVFAKPAEASA